MLILLCLNVFIDYFEQFAAAVILVLFLSVLIMVYSFFCLFLRSLQRKEASEAAAESPSPVVVVAVARKVLFSVLSVCLSVCEQDYRKTTGPIPMKLGGRL